jgi:hypothetical protein
MNSMNIATSLRLTPLLISLCLLSACTVDKFEARLQADPQCKAALNPKTGALMPCPGTDKDFYRSVGLMAPAPYQKLNAAEGVVADTQTTGSIAQKVVDSPLVAPKSVGAPVECKPQLHQKSGSLMPCPAP